MRKIGQFYYRETCPDAVRESAVYLGVGPINDYSLKYSDLGDLAVIVKIICKIDDTTREFDVTKCNLPIWIYNRLAVLNDVFTAVCMHLEESEHGYANIYAGQGAKFDNLYACDQEAVEYQLSKARILGY